MGCVREDDEFNGGGGNKPCRQGLLKKSREVWIEHRSLGRVLRSMLANTQMGRLL